MNETAVLHRAAIRSIGIALSPDDSRPVIGIANSASELNPCNLALGRLASAVKRGVAAAGGIPLEFPTISLGEDLMKPTAMLYRNLMAMDVEECLRGYPLDGVVLLAGCDKTVPAQLMAAASADLPAIMLTSGQRRAGWFHGQRLGAGTDLWRYTAARRAGELDATEWAELEACLGCSLGTCNVMGTASSMALLTEALGMMLPGTSSLATDDARLVAAAEATGRRAVELVREDLRPSRILTEAAFENAIVTMAAIGGSTNAVIHLCAIAGRRAISLSLDRIDEISRRVPVLADVRPSGSHLMDDFDAAGGLMTLLREIRDLLRPDTVTVTGEPLVVALDRARPTDGGAIRSRAAPLQPTGAIAVLRGNLAPDGAVLKLSAASPSLAHHRGRAIVFDGYEDLVERIDDPNLGATAESVLVLRGIGPVGAPGMPEWGMIPIPQRLLAQGATDMVRISDGRMSGTAYGTCILHVAPEAAVGGPLGLVESGDFIALDIERRSLTLEVEDAELSRRATALPRRLAKHLRGWPRLYAEHVLQAPRGCDFDLLVPADAASLSFVEPEIGPS
jgi:dihydroxy-acid dehydratase